jgi:hypothetical protein
MKTSICTLIFLLAAVSGAIAKDGGLLQTGSVSVSKWDNGPGGFQLVSRSAATNVFDRHGNMTKTVTLWDFNGDGIPEETSTNSLFYDGRGNLISSVEEFDAGADGTVDRRSIVIYTNLAGQPRPWLVLTDNNADGAIDEISTSTYTFDIDGRLIGVATEIDSNADGTADFYSIESWTYDLLNHHLFYTNNSDIYSPGVLEIVAATSYTLNEQGKPESATWWRYDPNYGLAIAGNLAFTYDKFGNLVLEVDNTLLPGPTGPSTLTTTTTFFYLHRGGTVRATPQRTPFIRLIDEAAGFSINTPGLKAVKLPNQTTETNK